MCQKFRVLLWFQTTDLWCITLETIPSGSACEPHVFRTIVGKKTHIQSCIPAHFTLCPHFDSIFGERSSWVFSSQYASIIVEAFISLPKVTYLVETLWLQHSNSRLRSPPALDRKCRAAAIWQSCNKIGLRDFWVLPPLDKHSPWALIHKGDCFQKMAH